MPIFRNALNSSSAFEGRFDRRRVVIMNRHQQLVDPLLCRNRLDSLDHHRSITMASIGRSNCVAEVAAALSQRLRQEWRSFPVPTGFPSA